MMVVVAMLGMIPAARASGIGSDVQRPLATVIVGGLMSTLFLTLLALPALYFVMMRRRYPEALENISTEGITSEAAEPGHEAQA